MRSSPSKRATPCQSIEPGPDFVAAKRKRETRNDYFRHAQIWAKSRYTRRVRRTLHKMDRAGIRALTWAPPARFAARAFVVAFAAYLACVLSFSLDTESVTIVPIWLPSGIGVAAIIVWGRSMAIPVFVADLVGSLSISGISSSIAISLAVGDTVAVLVAATIVRLGSHARTLATTRSVMRLTIGAMTASTISATAAIWALDSTDQLTGGTWDSWLRYWMSTVAGMTLVTPLLLTWPPRRKFAAGGYGRVPEALALIGMITAISWIVFVQGNWVFLKLLPIFPLFAWAIIRFKTPGAAGASIIFAAMAGYGVLQNGEVLTGLTEAQTIDLLQVLVAVVAVTNLALAAAQTERNHALKRSIEMVETFNRSEKLARSGSWEYLRGNESIWCSDGLVRLLGIETAMDRTVPVEQFRDVLPPELERRVQRLVSESRWQDDIVEFEQRLEIAGEDHVLSHTIAACRSPDGNPRVRFIGTVLDVTEARQLERFKDDLIATASHELRTPLTSIVGFSDTLINQWDNVSDEHRRRYIGIIDHEAHRLEQIVEHTLLQSQIDSGTLSSTPRPFLVNRAVRNAINHLVHAEQVELQVELQAEPGVIAVGDAVQLERVVDNLLTNACKYGDPPVQVIVRTIDAETVELRVQDHGAGVPHNFQSRLFNRFERGPDVGSAPGTGLGLSITKGLVERMGGRIYYERWDGASSFVVRLPRAPEADGFPS
ncbi:MAG: ATP-binding protein [Gaiellales bacterium]